MKLGVIADIHSNPIAFCALRDTMLLKGCTEFLFLGDYVSDFSGTAETMDLLRKMNSEYSCSFLRGNREDYMLAERERRQTTGKSGWLKNSASGNLLYSYEKLTEADLDWFAELPIAFRYEKEGYPAITCCHGSPTNARELLEFSEEPVRAVLSNLDTEYLLAAHTHIQGQLDYAGKKYYNPGACGSAINGQGYAHGLILSGEEGAGSWIPEFLSVPYDVNRTVSDIFTSGLYDYAPWFMNNNIHTLLTGNDCTPEFVGQVQTLYREEYGENPTWPNIDETYYERAAKPLGIRNYSYLRGIRPGTAEDAEAILSHYDRLRGGKAGWNETYPVMENILEDLSRDALFLMENEAHEVIASISIDLDLQVAELPIWNPALTPVGELSRLGIREDYQGRSIGRMMMSYAINELRNRGYKAVHILVNAGHDVAMRSYGAFSYQVAGECDLYGHHYVCMEREI